MLFAIHKSLDVTAEEIQRSIDELRDIPGVDVALYKDGWIIADPIDAIPKPWTRNKDDYRIEEIMDEVIYNKVELSNDSND